MFKDTQFVITFQLALIGVVLIGGLFLIWKAITRLEEKIDMMAMEKDCKAFDGFKQQLENAFKPTSPEETQDMMKHDSVMQQLFGGNESKDEFVMFTCPVNLSQEENVHPDVKVEEIETPPSEASGPISKNKLRTMNLEKLKKICEERNLSSEGTKNQLIERILQE